MSKAIIAVGKLCLSLLIVGMLIFTLGPVTTLLTAANSVQVAVGLFSLIVWIGVGVLFLWMVIEQFFPKKEIAQ